MIVVAVVISVLGCELVHDPIGLDAVLRLAVVIHERPLPADDLPVVNDFLRRPASPPESASGLSIGSRPVLVLPVSRREEIPLFLSLSTPVQFCVSPRTRKDNLVLQKQL